MDKYGQIRVKHDSFGVCGLWRLEWPRRLLDVAENKYRKKTDVMTWFLDLILHRYLFLILHKGLRNSGRILQPSRKALEVTLFE
jgi:hypothetical protein